MRNLLLIVVLAFLACLARSQQVNIPAIGQHAFDSITVASASSSSFPKDADVTLRNYTVVNIDNEFLGVVGYKLSVKVDNATAADAELDVVLGWIDLIDDASVGVAFFGEKAGFASNGAGTATIAEFAKAAWAFATRFYGLVEWADTDGNGQIQLAEILNVYNLQNASWGDFAYGRVPVGNVYISYAQVQTTDGVFAFRVLSSGSFVTITEGGNTFNINPATFKISISIRYFNNPSFSGASSNPNAQIAGVVGFGAFAAGSAAIGAVKVDNGTSPKDWNGNSLPNLALSSQSSSGGFSWLTTAKSGDSSAVIVGSTVYGAGAGFGSFGGSSWGGGAAYAGWDAGALAVFLFNATRPSSIVWDPAISTTSSTSPAAIAVPAMVLVVMGIASLLL